MDKLYGYYVSFLFFESSFDGVYYIIVFVINIYNFDLK